MSFGGFGTSVIAFLTALFFLGSLSHAISADPNFGISQKDRSKYQELALRSVVAVQAVGDGRRCSGTLISRSQVLTSAHCFDTEPGQPPPTFQIFLMNSPLMVERTITIKQVHVHPLWLISRKSIAIWNASLKKMYTDLKRISKASGESCPLQEKDWESASLRSYLEDSAQLVASSRRPKGSCAAAVVKIHDLLLKNKTLLDEKDLSDRETGPGDVAIADLNEDIVSDFHRPMEIDFDFEPVPDDNRLAFISGFGVTDERSYFAYPVNSLNVGYTSFRRIVGSDLLEISGSAVLCQGDSGGPTAYVKHGNMILVGVNAGTTGCNYVRNLSHATSVKAHADWLQSKINFSN